MQLRFDVASKTESLRLDGTTHFVLTGKLIFASGEDADQETELGQLTFPVPEDLFSDVKNGQTLVFNFDARDRPRHN